MPIDSSIYSNVRAPMPEINLPSPLDSAQKAMALSHMGMQVQQSQMQFQQQNALRQAYAQNTGADGSIDKPGVLNSLGRMGMGHLTPELAASFSKQEKEQADAQTASMIAMRNKMDVGLPKFADLLTNVPVDQRATVYPKYMADLKAEGIDFGKVLPDQYDEGAVNRFYAQSVQQKEYLDKHLAQVQIEHTQAETRKIPSEIAKNEAEARLAPAKLNAELYGSRSPNAELTGQYDKQATPIRGSQVAMNQMIDNYKNPSPQGDKSLILNAFKIKFPTAPDVNSLEELTKSQAATDEWKNIVHKYASGGLDQATRDNLMRDGVSTFRANVDTLRGYQEKARARAKFQNVDDPTITLEPAVDKTYGEAMDLQKKIGPYVPPTERGGIMSSISNAASKLMGSAAEPTAAAKTGKEPPPAPEMLRIKGPDGKIYRVPRSQKGAAIANGGSVVK